jgi:hypothetical protein
VLDDDELPVTHEAAAGVNDAPCGRRSYGLAFAAGNADA